MKATGIRIGGEIDIASGSDFGMGADSSFLQAETKADAKAVALSKTMAERCISRAPPTMVPALNRLGSRAG